MKHFTFTLDPVRRLREEAERDQQLALARELAVLGREAAAVAELDRRLAQARALGVPSGAPATGADLRAHQAYIESVERRRRQAGRDHAAQQGRVDMTRVRLEHAAREREAIDRLRRRRFDEHAAAMRRAEDAEMGEIALAAHRRALEAAA